MGLRVWNVSGDNLPLSSSHSVSDMNKISAPSSVAVPEIRVKLLVQLVICIPEPLIPTNMESSQMLRVALVVNSIHAQLAVSTGLLTYSSSEHG